MDPSENRPAAALGRIMLAVDGSAGSRVAEISAAAVAMRAGTEVVVVHVRDAAGLLAETPEEADELVAGVVSDLTGFGVPARSEVRTTTSHDVVGQLAAAVSALRPDLVVMGSRGRGDLAGLLLGSVSHGLLSRIDCPVMLIRGGRRPVARCSRILISVEGDEDAAALAKLVASVAEPRAEVLVRHVASGRDDARAVAPMVEELVLRLQAAGLPARSRRASDPDDVASNVAAVARTFGADLIVTGSHRPSDLSGYLRGSVSHEIAHLADGLLLIGPRQGTSMVRSGGGEPR